MYCTLQFDGNCQNKAGNLKQMSAKRCSSVRCLHNNACPHTVTHIAEMLQKMNFGALAI